MNQIEKSVHRNKEYFNHNVRLNEILKSLNLVLDPSAPLALEAGNSGKEALEKADLYHTIMTKERKMAIKINTVEKKYGKDVYSGKDIKEACEKHFMQLKRTKEYMPEVPADLGLRIEEFASSIKLEVKQLSNEFFIMADIDSFVSSKNQPNCVLFYRLWDDDKHLTTLTSNIAQEDDLFLLVYSWGDNYSWLNQFKKFYKNDAKKENALGSIIVGLIMFLLFVVGSIKGFVPFLNYFSLGVSSLIFISGYLFSINKNRVDWNGLEQFKEK